MREYNVRRAREEIEKNLLKGGHGIVEYDGTAIGKATAGQMVDEAVRRVSALVAQATYKLTFNKTGGSKKIYVTEAVADPLFGPGAVPAPGGATHRRRTAVAVDGVAEDKEGEVAVANVFTSMRLPVLLSEFSNHVLTDQASSRAADTDRVTGHGRVVTTGDVLLTVIKVSLIQPPIVPI